MEFLISEFIIQIINMTYLTLQAFLGDILWLDWPCSSQHLHSQLHSLGWLIHSFVFTDSTEAPVLVWTKLVKNLVVALCPIETSKMYFLLINFRLLCTWVVKNFKVEATLIKVRHKLMENYIHSQNKSN